MKKAIIICLVLISFSCTKEDLEQAEKLKVSPPVWLHGSWINADETSGNKGWKFTPDEIVEINDEGNELNLMSVYLIMAGLTAEEITVQEFEGLDSYSILINGETFSRSYDFSRISSAEMSWNNAPPFNAPEIYIKSN